MEIKKLNSLKNKHEKEIIKIEKNIKNTMKYSVEYYRELVELYAHKNAIDSIEKAKRTVLEYREELSKADELDFSKPSSKTHYRETKEEYEQYIKDNIKTTMHNMETGHTRVMSSSYFKHSDMCTKLKEEEMVASLMPKEYNEYIELVNKKENETCDKKEEAKLEKLQKKYDINLVKTKIHFLSQSCNTWGTTPYALRQITALNDKLLSMEHPVLYRVREVFASLKHNVEEKFLRDQSVEDYSPSTKTDDEKSEDEQLLDSLMLLRRVIDD